jgi:hypothetical protein
MFAFSQAQVDGVNVMSLPDAPKKEVPQLNDEMANLAFVSDLNSKSEPEAPKPKTKKD